MEFLGHFYQVHRESPGGSLGVAATGDVKVRRIREAGGPEPRGGGDQRRRERSRGAAGVHLPQKRRVRREDPEATVVRHV